jgi:hypothetical protein
VLGTVRCCHDMQRVRRVARLNPISRIWVWEGGGGGGGRGRICGQNNKMLSRPPITRQTTGENMRPRDQT